MSTKNQMSKIYFEHENSKYSLRGDFLGVMALSTVWTHALTYIGNCSFKYDNLGIFDSLVDP